MGFTKNHQFFIDVTDLEAGPLLLDKLIQAGISVNRTVPFDNIDCLRIGVQEITRKGFTKKDIKLIVSWFERILLRKEDPFKIRKEVLALVKSKKEVLFCKSNEENDFNQEEREEVAQLSENKRRWIDLVQENKYYNISSDNLKMFRKLAREAILFDQQKAASGNLSIKHNNKTIITISGCHIKDLKEKDFAIVNSVNDGLIFYKGAIPSSESYMHHLIYKETTSKVVVHTHFLPKDNLLKRFKISLVPPREPGSIKLAEEVAKACMKSSIVFIQKHGLVIHARTVNECLDLIRKIKSN